MQDSSGQPSRERIKSIVADALDVAVDRREAFVLDRCGGDDALLAEVRDMLAAVESAERRGFMTAPVDLAASSDPSPAAPESSATAAGTVIAGRYKLLEPIGEGGMGTVWMAEQRTPVKRLVALKLIKPGMDSRAVLARFDAERQALAMMDHPNIARVFDGGMTDTGRPYFVMELVKGLPLIEYADQRKMPVPQRLELFMQICSAVQHAHTKGVIHRDLKPANVLVTEHDGRPVPKVIDFGLAKALGGHAVLTDQTLHTAYGAVAGTPMYMAPEQVAINALDVDTRVDIYALGVLLYELLTGTTPLEAARLKQAAWEETARLIREEDAPRPSLRISSSNTLPNLAATRAVEPAKLSSLVKGDLDWIVLKALEKDRNRRYETASALGTDVGKHIDGEAVDAAPPSVGYRLRKFTRRHRGRVVAAGTVLVMLLIGLTGTLIFATKANRAAIEASRAALRADVQASEAIAQRNRAEQATEIAAANELAARHQTYVATVRGVSASLDAEDLDAAQRQLRSIDPSSASWELGWLQNRADESLKQFQVQASVLALSPDGDHAVFVDEKRSLVLRDLDSDEERVLAERVDLSSRHRLEPISFSPGGEIVGILDASSKIRLWKAGDGVSIQTHGYNNETAAAFAVTNRGILAWAGKRGDFHLSSLPSAAFVSSPDEGEVTAIAIHPQATSVAWTTASGSVQLWHATDKRAQVIMPPASGRIFLQLRFDITGRWLTWSLNSGGIYVFDTMAPHTEVRCVSSTSRGPVTFLGDDHIVINADDGIERWNLNIGSRIQRLDLPDVTAVAVSRDDSLLACLSYFGTLSLLDVVTWHPRSVLTGDRRFIRSMAFSSRAQTLRTTSSSGRVDSIRTWDTSGQYPLAFKASRMLHSDEVSLSKFALSEDARRAAVGSTNGSVFVVDTCTLDRLATLNGPDAEVFALAIDQQGRYLAASFGSEVWVWDLDSGRVRGKAKMRGDALAFRPGTSQLVGDAEWVWDVSDAATQPRVFQKRLGYMASGIAFLPDGKTLTATFVNGPPVTVSLDSVSVKTVAPDAHIKAGYGVATSADGTKIAVSGAVYDVATGQCLKKFGGADWWDACFSPDGSRLFTADGDVSLSIWDLSLAGPTERLCALASDKLRDRRAVVQDNALHDVAVSRDGKRVYSVGRQSLLVWDARSAREQLVARESAFRDRQAAESFFEEVDRRWEGDVAKMAAAVRMDASLTSSLRAQTLNCILGRADAQRRAVRTAMPPAVIGAAVP